MKMRDCGIHIQQRRHAISHMRCRVQIYKMTCRANIASTSAMPLAIAMQSMCSVYSPWCNDCLLTGHLLWQLIMQHSVLSYILNVCFPVPHCSMWWTSTFPRCHQRHVKCDTSHTKACIEDDPHMERKSQWITLANITIMPSWQWTGPA